MTIPAGKVAPGQKISTRFAIIDNQAVAVGNGYLQIQSPVEGGMAKYSIEHVKGCEFQAQDAGALVCQLPPFGKDTVVNIDVEFSEVKPEYAGEKHTFTWKLELANNYVVDTDATISGKVSYDVVPQYVDMKVESESTSDTAIAGEVNKLIFYIHNDGTWPVTETWVDVEVGIRDLFHPDNPRVKSVWVAVPDKEDPQLLHGVDCTVWVGRSNDARCKLTDIRPTDSAFVTVDWIPLDADIGKEFYFKIYVEPGTGEGDVGGSEEDNQIYGTGTVVAAEPDSYIWLGRWEAISSYDESPQFWEWSFEVTDSDEDFQIKIRVEKRFQGEIMTIGPEQTEIVSISADKLEVLFHDEFGTRVFLTRDGKRLTGTFQQPNNAELPSGNVAGAREVMEEPDQ